MADCSHVRLADVVLRFDGDASLVCHCTKFALSNPNHQIAVLKADRDKSISESFSDDFEQIFQFDEQQQPIQPQQPNLLFPVDAAQGRWSMLCQSKNFNEDSSPDLSWSSSSDSMTSVTSLDEAMLSLSSSDSEEEDSQKARYDVVDAIEDSLNRLSISPSRQNGNSEHHILAKSLGQAWIIPVQDAMRYFGFHFLPTNEDSRIISTEVISQQKDKQNAADHFIKSKKQLILQKIVKKEANNTDWLNHIAKRGACDIVVDALCGEGALTVQLAQTCHRVIAIDPNISKIQQAQRRAIISGVAHKVDFIVGDFTVLGRCLKADAVFLRSSMFNANLEDQAVCDLSSFHGQELFQQAKIVSNNVAFCLPSNQDARQLFQIVGQGELELEQCSIDGYFAAMAAYVGPLFDQKR